MSTVRIIAVSFRVLRQKKWQSFKIGASLGWKFIRATPIKRDSGSFCEHFRRAPSSFLHESRATVLAVIKINKKSTCLMRIEVQNPHQTLSQGVLYLPTILKVEKALGTRLITNVYRLAWVSLSFHNSLYKVRNSTVDWRNKRNKCISRAHLHIK